VLVQGVTAGSYCSKLLLGDSAKGYCWLVFRKVTVRSYC